VVFSVNNRRKGAEQMAKPKTKTQIIDGIAKEAGINKKQAKAALESLVAMAYKGAKDGFTIPGLGKLVIQRRKARMGRNPATGKAIKIPAKRVLKFRVAKAAKDAILPKKK
jgi:DNA-binding protein HU-beta